MDYVGGARVTKLDWCFVFRERNHVTTGIPHCTIPFRTHTGYVFSPDSHENLIEIIIRFRMVFTTFVIVTFCTYKHIHTRAESPSDYNLNLIKTRQHDRRSRIGCARLVEMTFNSIVKFWRASPRLQGNLNCIF